MLPDKLETVRSAFPSAVRPDVDRVLEIVPPSEHDPRTVGDVVVRGERVAVLNRFYAPEPDLDAIARLSDRQRLIVACVYSCHHDGFVRERQVPNIRGSDPWLPIFVLRLIGDYVIEIGQTALDHIDAIPSEIYAGFADENPDFMDQIRDRVVSYRAMYRVPIDDYPGFRFLEALGLWTGRQMKRHAARARSAARQRGLEQM